MCGNDKVTVIDGFHAGRSGTVVVIKSSREALMFLVEFDDGTDEVFPLHVLERMDIS